MPKSGLPAAIAGSIVIVLMAAAPAGAAPTYFLGDERQPAVAVDPATSGPRTAEVVSKRRGEVVQQLSMQAGENSVAWDGRTPEGPAAPGRYELRLAGQEEGTTFMFVDHVFPIRGPHDRGQSATNDFGGGRGHLGQDMFAECGTPVVAARGGRVREVAYNGVAGHHVVITSRETELDYVYMHLRDRPRVRVGDTVRTRESLGRVGDSGNAWGCHLHFELWRAPGWWAGGEAFDPLPRLSRWDGWS